MTKGKIMKALSGFYYVKSDGKVFACKGRGLFRNQNINPLVGDHVTFEIQGHEEGYITEVHERSNELKRPPIANVTQAFVVISVVEPSFSSLLLDRFITILEFHDIKPVIVMTKKDLTSEKVTQRMKRFQADYEKLGYTVHFLALNSREEVAVLNQSIKDEVTVLVGQSGVGKSTLLNRLDSKLNLNTGSISTTLGRGKHTTRHVELIEVHHGLIADTPGFSALDFAHINAEQLQECFIEIAEYSSNCKFRSCLHDKEPNCNVKKAVSDGNIQSYRYQHYVDFLQEILSRKPRYSS